MRRWLFLCAVSVVLASEAPGALAAYLPSYTVFRAHQTIVVDGVPDETDWAMAPAMTEFAAPRRTPGQPPPPSTTFRALWTDDTLYLSFVCTDASITTGPGPGAPGAREADWVEWMWIARPGAGGRALAVSPAGQVEPRLLAQQNAGPGGWGLPGLRSAVAVIGSVDDATDIDQQWSCELALPLSALVTATWIKAEVPQPDTSWQVEVRRYGGPPGSALMQWAGERGVTAARAPVSPGRFLFSPRSVRESRWAPPEYTVNRARGPIDIDGALDDPAWRDAAVAGPLVFPWWDRRNGDQDTTEVRALWDDDNLYIAWSCRDPYISAKYTKRDANTWEDDCVEAFIAPNPERIASYYGFEINCRAVWLDYLYSPRADVTTGFPWNADGVTVQSRIDGTLNDDSDMDRGWVVEASIPLANFVAVAGKPRPDAGDVWRVNFNRCGGRTKEQFSQWSPGDTPTPNFHRPTRFGKLTFGE